MRSKKEQNYEKGGKKRSGKLVGAADITEKRTKLLRLEQKDLNKLGQKNRKKVVSVSRGELSRRYSTHYRKKE